jgi:protein gp37
MSRTNIEWTHIPGTIGEVWNIVTSCDKVSEGCKHCYAEVMHNRLMKMQPKKYNVPFLGTAITHHDLLELPLSWKKPRTVFVNSMSDLFHKDVPFEFIRKALEVMYKCRHLHTFIILTKRIERVVEFEKWMVENINALWFGFDKNVWIVATVENQARADERIPLLLQVTARVRGLSCEPLLGPIDLKLFEGDILSHKINSLSKGHGTTKGIHWVICGGESGHKARPMHPDWARSLRDQCAAADIPFFFKQWGEWKPDIECKTAEDYDSSFSKAKEVQLIDADGKHDNKIFLQEQWPVRWRMLKTGKKLSGHLLDSKQHHAFPNHVKELIA